VREGVVAIEMNGSGTVKQYIGPLTMVAICFNICNSWSGVAGSMQIALLQGGPATLLYGMIVTTVVYMCIALTIAELASVYPTAGGQYHFASILAPKRYNRSISYTCGIVTAFSWIAIGAAVMMIPSTQIVALASFYHPSFVIHPWHYFLIYQAIGFIVLLYNIFFLKKFPRTHDIGCKSISSLYMLVY
jgi:choline transport protein